MGDGQPILWLLCPHDGGYNDLDWQDHHQVIGSIMQVNGGPNQ